VCFVMVAIFVCDIGGAFRVFSVEVVVINSIFITI
jgi:hypothetical protein